MQRKNLGMRIKEARLERKMTQSDLAGDFITRNMLSQIESGSASPSMKTLEYLSQMLNIPMSVLLADVQDEEMQTGLDLLSDAKSNLTSGNLSEVIRIVQKFPPSLFDEGHALLARAYFDDANRQMSDANYRMALDSLEVAQAESQKGLYASASINAQATLLIEKCCQKIALAGA